MTAAERAELAALGRAIRELREERGLTVGGLSVAAHLARVEWWEALEAQPTRAAVGEALRDEQ